MALKPFYEEVPLGDALQDESLDYTSKDQNCIRDAAAFEPPCATKIVFCLLALMLDVRRIIMPGQQINNLQ